MYSRPRILLLTGVFAVFCFAVAAGQNASSSLQSGFANPPESAKPRVWWHWMNGNITKEGIKLDLDWMHRVGLGGFQTFDAALSTPQVVKKRLVYMTPPWQDAFRYAISLGKQYGLEMGIAGSPGWSESGGPWVPASQGMKKYVWSETDLEGGRPFAGKLTHPPANTGAFQDEGIHDVIAAPPGSKPIPEYYADSVVVAFRRPEQDVPLEALHPVITASGGSADLAMLFDGDLDKTFGLPLPPVGEQAWIQYEFSVPTTMRSITYAAKIPTRAIAIRTGFVAPTAELEASSDGQTFRPITALPSRSAPESTISFQATTAKYFRITFSWPSKASSASAGRTAQQKSADTTTTYFEIAELALHSGVRVNRFEDKAAFTPEPDLYGFATPPVRPEDAIPKSGVIDLTSKMRSDGTLDWTPPPGRWVVLRFGYSLLGITNHPATAEATGLEVDKLDGRYVRSYMETYLNAYRETVGAGLMGKRGLSVVVNDSWEAGSQNWTDNMIDQFKRLRGYDPVPWMPVLAGYVVQSSAASDRFLWDFRKTISDLIATQHYGQLETILHQWGMRHYGESHENGRHFVADGMEVKKYDEVPMGAMWVQTPGAYKRQPDYDADDRESASVAHIYGQNLAAAESLTTCNSAAAWAWSPATLKPTADKEFLDGINLFVIHESAHQPLVNKAPGMTLGPCGQWFNRNETWANEAGPWVHYLARNSYMLQQGHFGADVIYFYGEDSNLTAIYNKKSPNLPAGYGFDYVNADALIHVLKVDADGHITTPGGTTYRILGLGSYSSHMSLPVLRAIHQLVMDGATVAGAKPADDPSLADSQTEFHTLVNELFGDGSGVHHVGKGTVYAGDTVAEALKAMHVAPDFSYTSQSGSEANLKFVHRKLADGDIYFVDNRSDHPASVEATFRVSGHAPQLWYSETGDTAPVSYSIADGRTTVPLKFGPWGSVFVVFRKPAAKNSLTLPPQTETTLATIHGPWKVAFQSGRGAPASITMDTLIDWSKSDNSGVKYFSGIGTYTKTVEAPSSWFQNGAHLWINLGNVKNLAVVYVNGREVGETWHAPYRVDATSALQPGANQITIKVVNAWVNRIIGDQQPGVTKKYTFTDVKPYQANSPLLASGLLGPVTVVREEAQ